MSKRKPLGSVGGKAPIAVALDAQSLTQAVEWAQAVAPHVSYIKVGLETYLRDGMGGLDSIRSAAGNDVGLFLDLKLHDIPNTVAGGARSVSSLHPDILTVHALGGPSVVAAAADALPESRIAAVTILTSMSDEDLQAIGIDAPARQAVVKLSRMATNSGAKALVCSPQEVADVRGAVGDGILLITPGVRPVGQDVGDQQRVSTPEQALADGSDLLVIGRPITGSDDPRQAAAEIARQLL